MRKRNPFLGILPGGAFSLWLFVAAFFFVLPVHADTAPGHTPDYADMDLSDLMKIPVVTASKFEQQAAEAPSSITVITSEEIKRYGYRTLADILASVQGFYVTYDRNYDFLGASGVNLGDFNSRVLLLVNGHRLNSDLNDSAYIDTTFILDVDLIDRVEIIRGPGSVLYGNNAFFGVINVITREAKQVGGAEISGSYGSFNAYTGRVTLGTQLTNGFHLMLSGTLYNSDGPENLFYPQFNTPAQNNGVAHKLDDDGFGSFFGSVGYKDFTLEGAFIDRQKGNPTAQYDTTFNDPRLRTDDDRSYVTLKYAHNFENDINASADIYYDRADFGIQYPQVPFLSAEKETGEWAGGEVQLNKKIFDRHILTVGAEYRDDFRQDRQVFEPGTTNIFADVHSSRRNYGIFAQGEFAVMTNLHADVGIRYDQYGHFDPSFSPRAAVIYNPFEQSTFKFIYGTAFRDPNFVELSDPRFQNIKREKITSYDVVYEQGIIQNLSSSISGYYNHMDDLINFQNGTFTNFNADTLAMELALEGKWQNGFQTRISYTLQHTQNLDTESGLPDSPMQLVKFNAVAPVWRDKLFAGLEVLYTGKRHTVFTDFSAVGATLAGSDVPGYAVVNLTLFSQNLVKNLEVSASIYNLLDNAYSDPSSSFHLQNSIQQDGRTFRVKLTYRF